MQGMTGKFSPDVQAEILGQSTAPIPGPTALPPNLAAASSGAAGASTTGVASANSGATNVVKAGWFGALIGGTLVATSLF